MIQIMSILLFRKVNQSWADKNIKQKCKEDIVHIGDNWVDFCWPSPCVLRNGIYRDRNGIC